MAKMMETLESRQMFSVALAEPTDLSADAVASSEEVVVAGKTADSGTRLVTACVKGKHFPTATITM